MNEERTQEDDVEDKSRLVYKLHPTFVVLRSQQLNMADSMNPDQIQTDDMAHRLIPDCNVPVQIVTPDNSSELGSRHELVSRDKPTVLPHAYQQLNEEEISGEEQLRRHVETTQQQQQNLFTGPFLLFRTPEQDHKLIRRLRIAFYALAVLDIFVLMYLHFGVRYFPFLSKISILELFGINTSREISSSKARAVLEPIQFILVNIINAVGCLGIWRKNIRLLTVFIIATTIMLIIDLMTFVSLFAIFQISLEIALLACSGGIRSKLVSAFGTLLTFRCIIGTQRISTNKLLSYLQTLFESLI
jgi:hypothetical protein